MKTNLIILNKSFHRDIERSLNLYESIKKHNKDKIPFFLSVPEKDFKLFREKFPKDVKIFTDEEIWKKAKLPITKIKKLSGWKQQQIVKLTFYKMNISENYLTIDSDSYFHRDFYKKTFLKDSDIPNTFVSRKKNFDINYAKKLWQNDSGILNNKMVSLMKVFESIKSSLGGDIKDNNWNYYIAGFGIWSTKALKSLNRKIKKDLKWTFIDMIDYAPYEMQWYGQWIYLSKVIPIYRISDIFCIISSQKTYDDFIHKYVDLEKDFKYKKYLGVTIQTCIKNKLRYKPPKTFRFWLRNKIRNLRQILKYSLSNKL